MNHAIVYATGKRKNAIAKIFLLNGNGKIIINGKSVNKNIGLFFNIISKPFIFLKNNQFDVQCTTKGGGMFGQIIAIQYGISKALSLLNTKFRKVLKKYQMLTRDSRKIERKKYGQPKARKKFQFSKR